MFTLNSLKNNPGSKKKGKRVGRGIGSTKGKTAGRGVKGQKARSGVAIKGFEGGQMPLIKRLPKRGFNSLNKNNKPLIVNLSDIAIFLSKIKISDTSNIVVNREFLQKANFFKKSFSGKVKILGRGEITIPLSYDVDLYAESAKEKIQSSGGKILNAWYFDISNKSKNVRS